MLGPTSRSFMSHDSFTSVKGRTWDHAAPISRALLGLGCELRFESCALIFLRVLSDQLGLNNLGIGVLQNEVRSSDEALSKLDLILRQRQQRRPARQHFSLRDLDEFLESEMLLQRDELLAVLQDGQMFLGEVHSPPPFRDAICGILGGLIPEGFAPELGEGFWPAAASAICDC